MAPEAAGQATDNSLLLAWKPGLDVHCCLISTPRRFKTFFCKSTWGFSPLLRRLAGTFLSAGDKETQMPTAIIAAGSLGQWVRWSLSEPQLECHD